MTRVVYQSFESVRTLGSFELSLVAMRAQTGECDPVEILAFCARVSNLFG